jgi:hypothetical protein
MFALKDYILTDKANGNKKYADEAEVRDLLKNSVKDLDLAIAELNKGHAQQTSFTIIEKAY